MAPVDGARDALALAEHLRRRLLVETNVCEGADALCVSVVAKFRSGNAAPALALLPLTAAQAARLSSSDAAGGQSAP